MSLNLLNSIFVWKMNKIYSIYKITNLMNNKMYVGFTSQNPPAKRIYSHCSLANTAISKAIQKYGKENFKFEVILQGMDRNDVLSMETYFIETMNTLSPNGYNLTTGGENYQFSEEIKNKMSVDRIGKNNPRYGTKHKESTKLKMSESSMAERNGMFQIFGKDNHRSQFYLILLPNNKIENVHGLSHFCKSNGINRSSLYSAFSRNKPYKNFKIIGKSS